MKNSIFFVIIATCLSSCSTTIDFKSAGNRFHTPESSGDTLNGKIQFGFGKAHKYETATLYADSIFSSSVTKNTEGRIVDSKAFTYDLFVGVIEELDIYTRATEDSAGILGVKYQFYGKGTDKGHRGAIMAGYGSAEDSESSQRVSNETSQRLYKADLEVDAWELELLYGYRFNDNIQLYTNLNYASFDTKTTLQSESFDTEIIKAKVKTMGLLFGADLRSDNKRTGYIFESGVVRSEWENLYDDTEIMLGLNFYWNWH